MSVYNAAPRVITPKSNVDKLFINRANKQFNKDYNSGKFTYAELLANYTYLFVFVNHEVTEDEKLILSKQHHEALNNCSELWNYRIKSLNNIPSKGHIWPVK